MIRSHHPPTKGSLNCPHARVTGKNQIDTGPSMGMDQFRSMSKQDMKGGGVVHQAVKLLLYPRFFVGFHVVVSREIRVGQSQQRNGGFSLDKIHFVIIQYRCPGFYQLLL
ncbi:hypothetical protein [Paenibacillus durus]|uniref:hypothetical protein n=1 Tax=Paenibacillus durus TaxID=44251 RepID=UPI00046E5B48|nr:hypothetical protein [Paenibacillus durus]